MLLDRTSEGQEQTGRFMSLRLASSTSGVSTAEEEAMPTCKGSNMHCLLTSLLCAVNYFTATMRHLV